MQLILAVKGNASLSGVTESEVAIIGAGPAGVMGYVTLRYFGMPAADITVFDARPSPLLTWAESTASIAQGTMRSESEGHFFPTDFPGFALMDAIGSLSPLPLVRSAFNRYHPSLQSVLRHGRNLAQHLGMEERVQPLRVTRLERDDSGQFVLYDAEGTARAQARHVLLALGHGPLRWPAACEDEDRRALLAGRLFHAYQPKAYGPGTALVIGAGMAAATEWINVLRGGGSVISMRRSARLRQQPLSAPRCTFGGPWLDHYHTLPLEERRAYLADASHGSFPGIAGWKSILDEGARSGRLDLRVGEVASLEPTSDGVRAAVQVPGVAHSEVLEADRVIAATGFRSGWEDHELLRCLVAEYSLETVGPHLVLADDCCVPGISQPGSLLALAGPLAAWAYPAGDSFAGMKYAARRFAEHVVGRKGFGPGRFMAWCAMIRGGWPYSGAEGQTETCVSP